VAWDVFVVHWLHVAFGIFWAGSIAFTRVTLFPALATLPKEQAEAARGSLLTAKARQITLITAGGTVVTGILRGLMTGVLDQLNTSYGWIFILSGVLGILMFVFLLNRVPTPAFLRTVYVAAFPVIFTMMVLMRFGGF